MENLITLLIESSKHLFFPPVDLKCEALYNDNDIISLFKRENIRE